MTAEECKSVNCQLRLLGQYYKMKKYSKGGKKKEFFMRFQSEIELYEVAKKELKEICGDGKLPAVQILKERKAELTKKNRNSTKISRGFVHR